MRFIYQARTKEGDLKSGVIEASSREAALNLLQRRDLFVTYLKEESPPFYAREIKIFRRISVKDIVNFTRQFSILLSSQVPLIESLSTLANQTRNEDLKEIIFDLVYEVDAGSSLSKALLKQKEIFSPFFIAMVKAGEASGKLPECLSYLADNLEREYKIRSKTTSSLIYPGIIFFVFLAILSLIMFSVLPAFEKILLEREIEIPLITKIILSISRFLRKYFFFLFFPTLISIFLLFRYSKTEGGKKIFEKIILKIPIVGEVFKISILSRISANLSTLLSAGLMITDSLEILEELVGNEIYKKAIFQIKEGVKKGKPVSSLSSLYPEIFPPMFNQMISVGEKTGNLPQCLAQIATFYEREFERATENILRLLEPLLIIFLGGLVGGLMLTILLPLYRIIGTF